MKSNRKIELYRKFIDVVVEKSSNRADAYKTLSEVIGMTDEEIREEVESLREFIDDSSNGFKISAFVEYKGNTLVLPLPISPMDICEKLSSIGMNEQFALCLRARDSIVGTEVPYPINEMIASVKLMTENSIGFHLIKLFNNALLSEIDVTLCAILNSPVEIHPELYKRLYEGCYSCHQDLIDDVHLLTEDVGKYTTVFCFPLIGTIICDGDEVVVNNTNLMDFKHEIKELLDDEQQNDDMTQYFNDDEDARKKVVSIRWDTLELKGKLYGKVVFRLNEPFTDREKEIAREWVEGQNSDGFGEGLEQRVIETEDDDLYVSLWFNNGDYFVYDELQMSEYVTYGGLLT